MINRYFLAFLFGLLAITLFGIVAPDNLSMVVEQIANGFKAAGCLVCLYMWGTCSKYFSKLVVTSFSFFNGIMPILATWHAFNVIMLHEGGGFLFNSLFHYAVIILAFGQYYLTKDARN